MRKGDSMGEFLRKVRDQLAADFREMRGASVDQMLYIKEDLIIPHDFTFNWFILNKARGKSGPVRAASSLPPFSLSLNAPHTRASLTSPLYPLSRPPTLPPVLKPRPFHHAAPRHSRRAAWTSIEAEH